MLLQMLLQKWEWKNKAIPRTPKGLKKKKGFTQILYYNLLFKSWKFFLKSQERKCFVAHSLTHFHFNTCKSFSLSLHERVKEVWKILKSYVWTRYNKNLIQLHHWEMCLNLILLTKLAVSYEQLHTETLGNSKNTRCLSLCIQLFHSCNVARKSKAMIIVLTCRNYLTTLLV